MSNTSLPIGLKKEEIEEGDVLIGAFMAVKSFQDHRYGKLWIDPTDKDGSQSVFSLRYHSDWNWLMPALFKFKGLVFNSGDEERNEVLMNLHAEWWGKFWQTLPTCNLEINYKLLVEAIKWLNMVAKPLVQFPTH